MKVENRDKPCAFCGETNPLRVSHVIPAFVFRWLRGSSGHIRNTDNPNKRVQDGLKFPWLCGDCEAMFSRYETEFAGKVFHPWLDGNRHIEYSEWLLKFCVSVSWRVLKFARGRNPKAEYTVEQEELLASAEARWRAYLNEEVPHPAKFEQHLLVTDVVAESSIADLPSNLNRFLTRDVTLDIVGSSRSVMTFAKMGRFIVFGMIQKGPTQWEGTKVHLKHGVLKPGRIVVPAGLLDLFREKAAVSAERMSKISQVQKDKIDQNILDNLDAFRDSDQFRAILADMDMFGDEAVTWKDSEGT